MSIILSLKEAKDRDLIPRLGISCEQASFSTYTTNIIQNYGVDFIWQLVEKDGHWLHKLKNLGKVRLDEIKTELSELGLMLDMRLTDALKHELGAPLTGNEPHEEVEPSSSTATTTTLPSIDALKGQHWHAVQDLGAVKAAIGHAAEIRNFMPEAALTLDRLAILVEQGNTLLQRKIDALQFVINHYDEISPAFTSIEKS